MVCSLGTSDCGYSGAVFGSLIPFVLMALNIILFRKAAILSIGLSVLFLTGLVIFRGREFKEELYKKLHV